MQCRYYTDNREVTSLHDVAGSLWYGEGPYMLVQINIGIYKFIDLCTGNRPTDHEFTSSDVEKLKNHIENKQLKFIGWPPDKDKFKVWEVLYVKK